MLQRQVEERARGRYEAAVEAALDSIGDEALCHRVLRERRRRAAVDVARELVEHDDEGEAAARGCSPRLLEFAAGGALVERAEALAYPGVVLPAVAEPHLPLRRVERAVGAATAEPEVQYLLD